MSIILLLAVQAAGHEVTTFHSLPGQCPEPQAQHEGGQAAKPAAPKPPEQIAVLSVRKVSPDTKVVFVPPPEEIAEPPSSNAPEQVELLSVRKVHPDTKVVFVPPPPEAPTAMQCR